MLLIIFLAALDIVGFVSLLPASNGARGCDGNSVMIYGINFLFRVPCAILRKRKEKIWFCLTVKNFHKKYLLN